MPQTIRCMKLETLKISHTIHPLLNGNALRLLFRGLLWKRHCQKPILQLGLNILRLGFLSASTANTSHPQRAHLGSEGEL